MVVNVDLLTREEIESLVKKASKLEQTVVAFKQYDLERKRYYDELEVKVG